MRTNRQPLWLCLIVLMGSILWRILGAPVTPTQFANLSTHAVQARILLPVRAARIWQLWLGSAEGTEHRSVLQDAEQEEAAAGQLLRVFSQQENSIREIPIEEYVRGVVAAEMPAQYHLEALKAQAVAARTRALQQKENGGCSRHPGADVCTDSTHCQGYESPEQLRERWQDSYESCLGRIAQAQRETAGEVITYGGELITVLYHAISGGRTEDAEQVFAQNLPYLAGVESLGEEGASGFWQDQTLTYAEMARRLNEEYHTQVSAEEIRRSLSISACLPSGRVKSITVGGREMSASAFRQMMGLRSAWFSITGDSESVTFHQRGYGHGVGMSQAGANAMAANGKTYQQILLHYYSGVQLEAYDTAPCRTAYDRRDANAAGQQVQEQSAQAVSQI